MIKTNTPIQIGGYTLKNRITFAPTVKFDFTDDSGKANEKLVAHYTERAKGGCGLICVEATAVTPGGRFCKLLRLFPESAGAGQHPELSDPGRRSLPLRIIQCHHTRFAGCRVLRPCHCVGGHRLAGRYHAGGAVEGD